MSVSLNADPDESPPGRKVANPGPPGHATSGSRFAQLVVAPLVAALWLAGCGAGSQVDVRKVNRVDRVAVVSIAIPKGLDVGELDEDADDGPIATVTREFSRGVVDFQPAAQQMRHYLFNDFADAVPFGLVSENEVLPSRRYQKLTETEGRFADEARMRANAEFVTPSSYRRFGRYVRRGESWRELFLSLPNGTDAVLFLEGQMSLDVREVVHMTPPAGTRDSLTEAERERLDAEERREAMLRKARTAATLEEGDTVAAGVRAQLELKVFDRRKNALMTLEHDASSAGSVRFAYGEGYPLEATRELVEDATGRALDGLTRTLNSEMEEQSPTGSGGG